MTDYSLWINDERTVLVRFWHTRYEFVEVCMRETPNHTWGPPIYVKSEAAAVVNDGLDHPVPEEEQRG